MSKARYASVVQWELDLRWEVQWPMVCCALLCSGVLLSGDLQAIENIRHAVDGEGDISEDSDCCLLDVRHHQSVTYMHV